MVCCDSQLFVDDGCKLFKVGYLLCIEGICYVEIEQVVLGDIVVVVKVEDIYFDVVLYDLYDEDCIQFVLMVFL